jgi:hypothetical protein
MPIAQPIGFVARKATLRRAATHEPVRWTGLLRLRLPTMLQCVTLLTRPGKDQPYSVRKA